MSAGGGGGNYGHSQRKVRTFQGDDVDYIHETIMFFIEFLSTDENIDGVPYQTLTKAFCEAKNLKPLKHITIGDSSADRVLNFLLQHPSIFTVEALAIVSLRRMEPDLDDRLQETINERTTDFIVHRCRQYGTCKIPVSMLFGNLHQASFDVRSFFTDFTQLHLFLKSLGDVFVNFDGAYVALKTVVQQCEEKNIPLLKSDEYLYDQRVLNRVAYFDTLEADNAIQSVMRTNSLVAIDIEGVNLGSPSGCITLVQMAFIDSSCPDPDKITPEELVDYIRIYLFDMTKKPCVDIMTGSMKQLLESQQILKIFQGCTSDAAALKLNFEIELVNVFDTVAAHRVLKNDSPKSDLYHLYERYVGEPTNRMKKDIKKFYIKDHSLWARRPLSNQLLYYAAFDVYALIRIYFTMLPELGETGMATVLNQSSQLLSAHGKRKTSQKNVASDKQPVQNSSVATTTSGTSGEQTRYHEHKPIYQQRNDVKYRQPQAMQQHPPMPPMMMNERPAFNNQRKSYGKVWFSNNHRFSGPYRPPYRPRNPNLHHIQQQPSFHPHHVAEHQHLHYPPHHHHAQHLPTGPPPPPSAVQPPVPPPMQQTIHYYRNPSNIMNQVTVGNYHQHRMPRGGQYHGNPRGGRGSGRFHHNNDNRMYGNSFEDRR